MPLLQALHSVMGDQLSNLAHALTHTDFCSVHAAAMSQNDGRPGGGSFTVVEGRCFVDKQNVIGVDGNLIAAALSQENHLILWVQRGRSTGGVVVLRPLALSVEPGGSLESPLFVHLPNQTVRRLIEVQFDVAGGVPAHLGAVRGLATWAVT